MWLFSSHFWWQNLEQPSVRALPPAICIFWAENFSLAKLFSNNTAIFLKHYHKTVFQKYLFPKSSFFYFTWHTDWDISTVQQQNETSILINTHAPQSRKTILENHLVCARLHVYGCVLSCSPLHIRHLVNVIPPTAHDSLSTFPITSLTWLVKFVQKL